MNQSAFQQVIREAQLRLGWSIFGFLLSLVVGYHYSEEFVFFFALPTKMAGAITEFLCTQMTEAFRTYLKVSFVVSLYANAPLFFYQIWCFLIPSCTKQKRQSATRWLIVSGTLFYGAFLCAYCFIVPITWSFFINQCSTSISLLHFELQPKIYDYMLLLFRFMLIFGLCSQVPLAVAWFIKRRAQKKALRFHSLKRLISLRELTCDSRGDCVPHSIGGMLAPHSVPLPSGSDLIADTGVPHCVSLPSGSDFIAGANAPHSVPKKWNFFDLIRPPFHSSPIVFHSLRGVISFHRYKLLFYRKKIFFFSICIAAFISPPDVLSQLIVLLPTYLLIEIVIFYEILLGEYNLVG